MSFTVIRGRLVNAQQAHAFMGRIWTQAKPWLLCDGGPLRITVQEDTRTLEQNAMFHDCCDDIAKSRFPSSEGRSARVMPGGTMDP